MTEEEAQAKGMNLPSNMVVTARMAGGSRVRHTRMKRLKGRVSDMAVDHMNRLWIVDSGSMNDLVPESAVCRTTSEIIPNTKGRLLQTANGVVVAKRRVRFRVPELDLAQLSALHKYVAQVPERKLKFKIDLHLAKAKVT